MKLRYYKLPKGERNFGDELNPWLWEKLIPGILDEDASVAFVGIGSLINNGLPQKTRYARKIVIFGTGVGYGKGVPKIDESYTIYCVRGLLSAQALGISEKLAITDGAVLIRQVFSNQSPKKYRFSYMPHYELAGKGWETVCQKLGFGYIDPRWSVEQVLSSISETEILLAEAMHGAIIADALRVPWLPITTNSSILAFKWQDWCSSIGVEYQPIRMKRLHHPKESLDILTPFRTIRDWNR
ncbi:exopolysaccharide glucosyl ketal-pyruvate-transferase [Microcystis aeruginosa NIES-4325]|uniref:Exopolysaccharide glucosyl ketal-pyruvate-transferase n=3 Tax=Microcystaceae TaxID=1890449 RepID=A0A5J4F3P5_MICAE|nr:polysaccharide pyruvyl transferase family protein [Microcystis aeruginosa]GEA25926.1 exopolysaccharide glucosyl ketal-pyruvate-transferase [Microcystis aeruginosa NIES-4325]